MLSEKRSLNDDGLMPPVALVNNGELVWRAPHRNCGLRADLRISPIGYRIVQYKERKFFAHRLVWRLHYGCWPDGHIDHADCNRSNNNIENLRIATASQNRHNTNKVRSASGYKGVCWNRSAGKWQASIGVRGKKLYLGLFTNPSEASNEYAKAAKKHFGEFARG